MQVQKISIRRAILEVAREELFEKGFKGTSMRSIAQKSEVGLSNIYNYFKNKDEILLAVIQPLLNAIDKMEAEHNDEKNLNIELLSSDAFLKENIVKMVNLVEGFRRELRLLFFHAYGSSLENFKNEFIDRSTRMGIEFLRKIKAKYPFLNTEISP
ncbi:MAG: TetR/AcrR family transcriptional regulator, partial [Bacteroidota bacterium]